MYRTEVRRIPAVLVRDSALEELKREEAIRLGARLLREGELVAFPTETVYGLGADATSERAVSRIFAAKGRPQDNPLIVHIAGIEQLPGLIRGRLPETGERLVRAFWPGPLTIIYWKSDLIPDGTTAGLDSLGIRIPSHPVARALLAAAELPVAAPSANLSGSPSTTLASHVYDDLAGKIPLIIDGGPARIGMESTVVDIRGEVPRILRPGGLSRERIEELLGCRLESTRLEVRNDETPASPGMKYRHYSPETPLILIPGEERGERLAGIKAVVEARPGQKIGLLISRETAGDIPERLSHLPVKILGSRNVPEEVAASIFALLREFDREGLDLIVVEAIPESGLGEAVMNRLLKASTGK